MKTTTLLPFGALLLALCCNGAFAAPAEHQEFEATLHAPFHGTADARRTFSLDFSYPGLERPASVYWKLELVNVDGRVVRLWRGSRSVLGSGASVRVA